MLTPASRATSSRRSPFTRRLSPYVGRPTWSGVSLARRLTRNSWMSLRGSTPSTLERLCAIETGSVSTRLSDHLAEIGDGVVGRGSFGPSLGSEEVVDQRRRKPALVKEEEVAAAGNDPHGGARNEPCEEASTGQGDARVVLAREHESPRS